MYVYIYIAEYICVLVVRGEATPRKKKAVCLTMLSSYQHGPNRRATLETEGLHAQNLQKPPD